jgi:phospholipase D1/2
MSFISKIKDGFEDFKADSHEFVGKVGKAFEADKHSHTHVGHHCHAIHATIHNRFHSFAPPRTQDKAKWFVDGCGYFYALSIALEEAQHDIWIMDWWYVNTVTYSF